MKQKLIYCKECKAKTPHLISATNHILHLLLTVFTAGIWAIIWIIVALVNAERATYCTVCADRKLAVRA